MKEQIAYHDFEKIDIRVGRIVDVGDARTKKPTHKLTVDFEPEIGRKVSCDAYKKYAKEELIGKQIVAVINFSPKHMGPEASEILILGCENDKGEIVYLTPESDVPNGKNIW